MTNIQPSEAAALLEEVDKRRQMIRRRLGDGSFELNVFGGALLVAGFAGLAGNWLGPVQGVVCAIAMVAAYLVVSVRYLRLRSQFGVGFDVFAGLLFSVLIFIGCSLAGWLLDGTARTLAIALIPTIGVLAMAFAWRQVWIVALAAVMLAGGLVDLVPGVNGWACAVVYGIGFAALAVLLVPRVNRSA